MGSALMRSSSGLPIPTADTANGEWIETLVRMRSSYSSFRPARTARSHHPDGLAGPVARQGELGNLWCLFQ